MCVERESSDVTPTKRRRGHARHTHGGGRGIDDDVGDVSFEMRSGQFAGALDDALSGAQGGRPRQLQRP